MKALKMFSSQNSLKKSVLSKPASAIKRLYVIWCIDSVDSWYKNRPLNYLKLIFINQGEGGISTYLRENNLALSISLNIESNSFGSNSLFSLVSVIVNLTDEGFENIEKILETIFSYVLMIKETSMEEHGRCYEE